MSIVIRQYRNDEGQSAVIRKNGNSMLFELILSTGEVFTTAWFRNTYSTEQGAIKAMKRRTENMMEVE